jgi:N-glycosylase/DNA lyase
MLKIKKGPLSILAIFTLIMGIISCKSPQTAAISAKETTASKVENAKNFGEKVSAKGAMPYDAMLSKMGTNGTLDDVKVVGKVETVCQAKGCWMNISSEKGAPSMHVDFKNYGFFMPKNIAGKSVVMVGKAVKEVVSVENQRHFAEDAGKSAEDVAKITQPKENVKFVASGVLILD